MNEEREVKLLPLRYLLLQQPAQPKERIGNLILLKLADPHHLFFQTGDGYGLISRMGRLGGRRNAFSGVVGVMQDNVTWSNEENNLTTA